MSGGERAGGLCEVGGAVWIRGGYLDWSGSRGDSKTTWSVPQRVFVSRARSIKWVLRVAFCSARKGSAHNRVALKSPYRWRAALSDEH